MSYGRPDLPMLALSYLISGGILLAAAIFQYVRRRMTAFSPAGMDLLGKSLFECAPSLKAAPTFAVLVWFAFCCLIDIVFPLLPRRAAGWEIVDSSLQAILAVDYVVLVPLLLWCYMSIACDLREAGDQVVAGVVRDQGKGHIVWWAAVCVAGFAFQYSTIHTQVGSCSSTPPWLWVDRPPTMCGDILHLNWQGAAHAALRGLDAMMGLGLAATVLMAAIRSGEIGGAKLVETHKGWEFRDGYVQCRTPLRRLSLHLVLAGSLAVAIALLHLLTIEVHRSLMGASEAKPATIAQFVGSTWVLWCAIAFVWAGIAVKIILAVYERAREEIRHEEADEVDQRIRKLPEHLRPDARTQHRKPSKPRDATNGDSLLSYLR